MRKLIFILLLISISIIFSCKKENPTFLHTGRYVGEFIYDSLPEKNFTDSFFCSRDLNNIEYEFLTINILDSIQKKIQIYDREPSPILTVYKNYVPKKNIYMNLNYKNNNVYGYFFDSTLTGKFSLIYTP